MKSPPAGDGISRLIVPERFGKYPVTGLLGRGAMGAVYRAFDPDIRRTVAIKTIRWDLLSEAGPGGSLAGRFRNEARAAGRLSHPGIVAVYEFGQGDDCAYIAMEYVEGSNLREYFSRKTAFSEADVVSPIEIRPRWPIAAARARTAARSTPFNTARASSRNPSPAAVSSTPRGRRVNSLVPSSFSSMWIC